MLGSGFLKTFPSQKLPNSKKGREWRKKCIDAVDGNNGLFSDEARATFRNKYINLRLVNGHITPSEIETICNPSGIDLLEVNPTDIVHYPLLNVHLEVLIGEEAKRRFDWKAIVTNPDAISAKELELKEQVKQRLMPLIENLQMDEQQIKSELKSLDIFRRYEFQDIRETTANKILRHYFQEQRFDIQFNDGFRDALTFGEEMYACEIIHGEPVLTKLNPLNVFTYRSGYSTRIEDADIIVLIDYLPPGKVLDYYYEDLSEKHLSALDGQLNDVTSSGASPANPLTDFNDVWPLQTGTILRADGSDAFLLDQLVGFAAPNGLVGFTNIDESGNVRRLRVIWKSWRKVKKVFYFDEFGDEQADIFDDSYIVNEAKGERYETRWIAEYWEGVKIADNIYIRMRPREVQYNRMNSPHGNSPGIVGTVYSLNNQRPLSLVDRMKRYNYLYDVTMDLLNKAMASNLGTILEPDFATIPDDWTKEDWMLMLKQGRMAFKNSFNVANKGPATGSMAGNLGQSGLKAHNVSNAQEIEQYKAFLEFLKYEMGVIAGVPPQRLGQVENRETVGGVERAVTQSSHVTEYWFFHHEELKLRAMSLFLETAKVAFKGKNKKVQFILDDGSIEMLNFDEAFAESDYGIVLSTSARNQELENTLKQLTHAALQNDTVSFSTAMDIFLSTSISDIKKRLETDMEERKAEKQQEMQEQMKQVQAQIEAEKERWMTELKQEEDANIRDNMTKLQIEIMRLEGQAQTQDLTPEQKLQLDFAKFELDRLKTLATIRKTDSDIAKTNNDIVISRAQLQQKDEEIAIKRKVANKPKPAAK